MTTNFSLFENKINDYLTSEDLNHSISEIKPDQFIFLAQRILSSQCKNILVITTNDTEVDNIHGQILSLSAWQHQNVLKIYGSGLDVYDGMFPSESKFFETLKSESSFHLTRDDSPHIIICNSDAILRKFPQGDIYKTNSITLEEGSNFEPDEIVEFLVDLGYCPSSEIDAPGTFINKGEVIDIFPINSDPIRVYFDFDIIDKIKILKSVAQKNEVFTKTAIISFAPNFIFYNELGENLKQSIPTYNLEKKDLLLSRREILSKINQKLPFQNFQYFYPCAFLKHQNIYEYFDTDLVINTAKEEILQKNELLVERLREINILDYDQVLPHPSKIFNLDKVIKHSVKTISLETFSINLTNEIQGRSSIENLSSWLQSERDFNSKIENASDKLNLLKNLRDKNYSFIFSSSNPKAQKEAKNIFKDFLKVELNVLNNELENGFINHAEKIVHVTDFDLFKKKIATKKNISQGQSEDLFAEQMANLSPGDYVIHKTHGIGKYLGLNEMDMHGSKSDFLIIEYDKQDKVYLPIYRINEIQKHASKDSAKFKLANLRTKNFLLQKKKIQNSIKKLAFDLIQLQAKRSLAKAFSFSPPNHLFEEFELAFPFNETPDQSRAIDRVLSDMQKSLPMDHLVCGDVGFGKTEVAIRAAYKAVLDQKQVAILVPTTILALQHFNSFSRRLKTTGVIIRVLTRFQTKSEVVETVNDLKEGKVDILIGTHKILSDQIRFNDLGLVIVDEEQRFGVNHKEKLKNLKENVDFLTLTATPIPRTMQISLLGLKEISLIKTPPPNRQAITTYVCLEDDEVIYNAITKEINRGGQVYVVNNNVKDLDNIYSRVKALIPNINISIAHGQLPERQLEKTVLDFYNGRSQVLLATTIIESGIDIPNANTMIVFNSDKFGLSQLHQLRGRIGRSERKAFVYFTIKSYTISDIAQKRLKALQRFSDLGGGFSIASSDLEIRGAGNIIGGDQSGHLDQIGLELYSELLEEAINDLKGQKKSMVGFSEVNSVFPAFIPTSFIKNNKIRLKTYKKLSNLKTIESIDNNQEIISDEFGRIPNELNNLLNILRLRLIFTNLGIQNVTIMKKQIKLIFNREYISKNNEVINQIIGLITERPNSYKLTQDYHFSYSPKNEVNEGNFYQISKDIADNIKPC